MRRSGVRILLGSTSLHLTAVKVKAATSGPAAAGGSNPRRESQNIFAMPTPRRFSLQNKWVLITGASSGFGAAAATAFGAEGAKLLLGARRVERLKTLCANAKKAGAAAAHFHELDVAQTASVETFFAWAKKKIANRNTTKKQLDVVE